jgi:hypothetical protein
LLPWITAM